MPQPPMFDWFFTQPTAPVDWLASFPPAIRDAAAQIDAKFETFLGPKHPLSQNLPIVSPAVAIACMIAYLLFVIVGGQVFKALDIKIKMKPVMRLYNFFMVVLSTYMGTKSLYLAYQSNSSLWCVPMATGQAGHDMAVLTWIFTYSKVIEFLDTVFMILEGRWRQVSFLHVYHHVSILSYWIAILWIAPGSDGYFSLAINSYIHVIMYGYYFLASFGYQPWWKYYITYSQILQFVSFAAQSIYVGYIKTDAVCDFPNVLSRGLLWYMLSLIALFSNFLIQNKFKKRAEKKAAAAGAGKPAEGKKEL